MARSRSLSYANDTANTTPPSVFYKVFWPPKNGNDQGFGRALRDSSPGYALTPHASRRGKRRSTLNSFYAARTSSTSFPLAATKPSPHPSSSVWSTNSFTPPTTVITMVLAYSSPSTSWPTWHRSPAWRARSPRVVDKGSSYWPRSRISVKRALAGVSRPRALFHSFPLPSFFRASPIDPRSNFSNSSPVDRWWRHHRRNSIVVVASWATVSPTASVTTPASRNSRRVERVTPSHSTAVSEWGGSSSRRPIATNDSAATLNARVKDEKGNDDAPPPTVHQVIAHPGHGRHSAAGPARPKWFLHGYHACRSTRGTAA